MSRNKDYQKLLNSKLWKELRQWKLRTNPLCERCLANGYVTAAVDVHHVIPVETAVDLRGMEHLCYSLNNLQSLCIPCHTAIHKAMGSSTKENHRKRSEERLARWVSKREQAGESRREEPEG